MQGELTFWIRFVLAALATWRVTHLLSSEDGPWDLVARFRARLGRRAVGKLMDCFNCLSFWIAAPAALFVSLWPLEWLMSWLGLSGAACLLERLGREPIVIQPLAEAGEGGTENVLRPETDRSAERSPDRDDAVIAAKTL